MEVDRRSGGLLLRTSLVGEPGSAVAVFGAIAGSVMAVVSIVYSVLVMSVTMASMQFSPRVVSALLRDPVSQNVLGIFTGTFLYSLLALRGVHANPPFVPGLTLVGAMLLAVASIAALIYFIDHMSREIQVNHLIAGIARDAARTIDAEMLREGTTDVARPPSGDDVFAVPAQRDGYLQLVDVSGLIELARRESAHIRLLAMPGDFIFEGAAVAHVSPSDAGPRIAGQVARAFDVGPIRTLQQDVAFGIRLIVDIGVKAVSPAINDPSTCSTCIDHLGALLRRAATREAGTVVITDGEAVRLTLPRPTFKDLLDLAFNQLRQYGRHDLAVANRILRALCRIAEVTEAPARLRAVEEQARLTVAGLDPSFPPEDRVELEAAYRSILRPGGSAGETV